MSMHAEPYVLIVDDHPAVCRVHADALRAVWLATAEAADGLAAVDMIRARLPAVIVTDRHMTSMDGMELVRWVRSQSDARDIPVVMVTADAGSEPFMTEARATGCDAILGKPGDVNTLRSIVLALLRHGRGAPLDQASRLGIRRAARVSELAPVRYRRAGHAEWLSGHVINLSESGVLFAPADLTAGAAVEVMLGRPALDSALRTYTGEVARTADANAVAIRFREPHRRQKPDVAAAG